MPIAGIGPATSPLPRECSTTEPNGRYSKTMSKPAHCADLDLLERETGIEPASLAWKARVLPLNYSRIVAPTPAISRFGSHRIGHSQALCKNPFIAGGEGWIRTSVLVRGQIYSLLPLTTRPPLRRTSEYSTSSRAGRSQAFYPGSFPESLRFSHEIRPVLAPTPSFLLRARRAPARNGRSR